MPNVLGIDYGSSRTGIAVADGGLAVPSETVEDASYEELLATLAEIVERKHITLVVVGLPIGLDGKETPQTTRTLRFIEDLRAALSIPIETQDERLTTKEARTRGATSGMDASAAAIMLQSYLDGRTARV